MTLITENGWRQRSASELDRGVVPGTNIVIPLAQGIPNIILKGWCAWFHANVEALNNARGGTDEGGWTPTNSVWNSNHLSGTAVDLNWSEHTFRVSYAGFTQAEINKVREGLRLFEGTIWWGQDWVTPKDAMHFQLNYREGDARNAAFATKLQNGYLNIWKGGGPITVPPAPVQNIYAQYGDNNAKVRVLQGFFNENFGSYSNLVVDGDFGTETLGVVKEFQKRVGVLADGIVGPLTLAELKKNGFKESEGAVAGYQYPSTDEMVKQIWEQMFGPQAKGFPDLFGKTADGKRGLYTVEAVADIRKRAVNAA